MDDNFLNDYFNDLNAELKNKRFISNLRDEFDELDKDKLKNLIEEHF